MPDAFGRLTDEERMAKAIREGRASPNMINQSSISPEQYAAANADLSGKEAMIAQRMRSGADALTGGVAQGKQAGDVYVAPTWSEVANNAAQKLIGGYDLGKARTDMKGLEKARTDKTAALAAIAAAKEADRLSQQTTENQNADRTARGKREYGEWRVGDGEPISGYIEEGIAKQADGTRMPKGATLIPPITRGSGSNYQAIRDEDAFGNTVVTSFNKGDSTFGQRTFVDGEPWSEDEAKRRGGQRAGQEKIETRATEEGKQEIKGAGEASEKIASMKGTLRSYEDALEAYNAGAETGRISSMFPTFTEATKNLETAKDEIALTKIADYTFGSLSEAEGQWLKDVAIPLQLDEDDGKKWVERKKRGLQVAIAAETYIEDQLRAGKPVDRVVVDAIKEQFNFYDEEEEE